MALNNTVQNNLSIVDAQYASTVWLTQLHPYYKREVIKMYGTDRLTQWIRMYGKMGTRPAVSYNHVEQGRLQGVLTTSGSFSGAAGAAVTVTLANSSLVDIGGSTFKCPVAIGFTVQFKDGTQAIVTDVAVGGNEAVIELTPNKTTQAISLASGEVFIYYPAVLVGEGSCATDSHIRVVPTLFNNTMQTVRVDYKVTDEALASFSNQVTFWDFYNPATNTSVPCWSSAALGEKEVNFQNAIEMLALTGQSINNVQDTAGNDLRGTTGLIPSIEAYGNIKSYAQVAGFQISDLDDMIITMEKNKAPNEYLVWTGIELNMDIQKAIKDWFPNGAVTYGSFSGQDNAIELGFTSIGYQGRTFHFHNMEVFNNPVFLGAAGFNYIGGAIVMPANDTVDGGGGNVKYVELVTLENSNCNTSLGYDHFVVDGTGNFQTGFFRPTNCRNATFTWVTTQGVEVFGAKQLFMIKRV
jgi:hypothetical protein